MGSLVLAGALQGLGKGIVQDVQNKNVQKENKLDRDHDAAIRRMSDKAADKRLNTQITANQDLEYSRQESNQMSLINQRAYDSEQKTQDQEFTLKRDKNLQTQSSINNQKDRDHDFKIKALALYVSQAGGNSGKGGSRATSSNGKWNFHTVKEIFTDENGFSAERSRLVVQEPEGPLLLRQEGITFVPEGTDETKMAAALKMATDRPKFILEAEASLMQKANTKDDESYDFVREFGYLPLQYVETVGKSLQISNQLPFEEFYKELMSGPQVNKNAPALSGIPAVAEPQPQPQQQTPPPVDSPATAPMFNAGAPVPVLPPMAEEKPMTYNPLTRRHNKRHTESEPYIPLARNQQRNGGRRGALLAAEQLLSDGGE